MMNQVTANLIMNPEPPTVYSILNSIANYGKEQETKKKNLASVTHKKIFDFDYELSSAINKDQFEIDILNHYLMRRIGYDTVTAFKIFLENKLHEILPFYNLMFDSLKEFDLFNSGEKIVRETIDNRNINNDGSSESESRFSEYPLDRLYDLSDGSYVSNQTQLKSSAKNVTKDDNVTNEKITRTPSDKISIYKSYLETKRSIMSMIYHDLDILFYGIVE